jgi:hypothetical protein
MLRSVRFTLTGLFLSAAFASIASAEIGGNPSSAPKTAGLERICESARLTDVERRECRAAFKAADDAHDLQVAYETFRERIGSPVVNG